MRIKNECEFLMFLFAKQRKATKLAGWIALTCPYRLLCKFQAAV
jgi:hypothetical protein